MSLATSGPISIGGTDPARSINAQFGRGASQQTSMSQLYRGGGIVGSGAPNVPTSGAISLSQFYGAANRISQTITISSNQTNYVANTAKVAGYIAGGTDVTFVINSGVAISSNSAGVFAFDVDTSWAAGDTVTVVNNGTIVGMGGNGGGGGGTGTPGSAGAAGGPALRVQRTSVVQNNGTIAGGGGGGGGGGQRSFMDAKVNAVAGGGGGGGGRSSFAANSSGGGVGSSMGASQAQAGGAGTSSGPGANGFGGSRTDPNLTGGAGGVGGGWGAAGASGTGGSGGSGGATGFSGGSAGAAVNGNANITWVATGTRLGAIT